MEKSRAYFPELPARLGFLLQDLKFGGTQRQTLELAGRLDQSKFQPEIWLLAAGDDFSPWAQERGIPLVRLSTVTLTNPNGTRRQVIVGIGGRVRIN